MQRNLSIDAYRGFVMLLMMAEVLRLSALARAYPGNPILDFLAFHQSHVPWVGCSLHDLIQPSFSFLVGVALPFSLAKRESLGASWAATLRHAAWRSFVLIALGIFLRSTNSPQTNFTFEDTLTQIGLGYFFLVLASRLSPRALWIFIAALLLAYWAAWAQHPGQWTKPENLGSAFDRWFLNLFPRPQPFLENRGGYVTLSFIPTLGTMLLGLVAGRQLRNGQTVQEMARLGTLILAIGLLFHFLGVCPIVKRIWTPTWTLASGGACFLLLSLFRLLPAPYFLLVIGANSIAAYLIAHLWDGFFASSIQIHLGWLLPSPFLIGPLVLALEWLCLHWMYQRKLFLKI